jgi:transcriptional regulator with XRE-family HTH domain
VTPEDRWLDLGDQLMQLRKAAGLSGKRLAELAGWQPSKVSRIENAKQTVTDEDIDVWCAAAGVAQERVEDLHAELRSIRLEQARFRSRLHQRGHVALQHEFAALETAANSIRVFENALVPGLLQTADYARALFAGLSMLRETPQDLEEAVNARMQRQTILYSSERQFEFLVTEAALRTRYGSTQIMISQLNRLHAVLGMHNVRFGIIPQTGVLPAAPMHGFWILDDLVNVEMLHTEAATRNTEDHALYSRILESLWELAVEGDETQALLTGCIADLKRTSGSADAAGQ